VNAKKLRQITLELIEQSCSNIRRELGEYARAENIDI
jgi:hypothetical protein